MHFSLSPIIVGASLATFIVAHPEHFYARDVEGPLFARDAYKREDLYARNYRFSDALARRNAEHDLVARNKRGVQWWCPKCHTFMDYNSANEPSALTYAGFPPSADPDHAKCARCGAAYQRVEYNTHPPPLPEQPVRPLPIPPPGPFFQNPLVFHKPPPSSQPLHRKPKVDKNILRGQGRGGS